MANGRFLGLKKSASKNDASGLWSVSEVHQNVLSETWTGMPIEVTYLVIGGGGGGSDGMGGGGGAGGYRCNVPGESSGGGAPAEAALRLSPGNYPITVGAGGTNDTLFPGESSVFASITSLGGGYGNGGEPQSNAQGGTGGSGGASLGAGTPGQGYDGGSYAGSSVTRAGGGGGGAGGVGGNAQADSPAGNGGPGVASSITGTSVYRAGGGGGGAYYNGRTPGTGGIGGGGNGNAGTSGQTAFPGQSNTGGGGGGAKSAGGNGGSGVVIFGVPSETSVSFSVGLTELNGGSGQAVGNQKIYTVTQGTGTVTFS